VASKAVVNSARNAAIEEAKKFLAELPEHHGLELRGKLEESIRQRELYEQKLQESQGELVRGRNEITDLLSGEITRLEELKEQQQ